MNELMQIKELNMDIYVKKLEEIYNDKMQFVEQLSDSLSQQALDEIKERYGLEMDVKFVYPFKDTIQVVLEYVDDRDLFFNYVFYTNFRDNVEPFNVVMHFDRVITNYLIYRIHKDYLGQFMINVDNLRRPSQMFAKQNIFVDCETALEDLNNTFLNNLGVGELELKSKFDLILEEKKVDILIGIINYLPHDKINDNNMKSIINKYSFDDEYSYFNYSFVLESDVVSIPNVSFSKVLTFKGENND